MKWTRLEIVLVILGIIMLMADGACIIYWHPTSVGCWIASVFLTFVITNMFWNHRRLTESKTDAIKEMLDRISEESVTVPLVVVDMVFAKPEVRTLVGKKLTEGYMKGLYKEAYEELGLEWDDSMLEMNERPTFTLTVNSDSVKNEVNKNV